MSTIDKIVQAGSNTNVVGQYVTNNRMPLDLRFMFDSVKDIEDAVSTYRGVLYDGLLAVCKGDNYSIYKFKLDTDEKGNPTNCSYERVDYLKNVSIDGNILTFTNNLGEEIKITLPEGGSGGTTSNFVNSVNGVSYSNVNNTTVNIVAPVMPTSTSAYNKSLGSQYDLLFWADPNHGRDSKEVITEMTAPKWASIWDLTRPAVSDENGVTGCAQKIYHDDGELV